MTLKNLLGLIFLIGFYSCTDSPNVSQNQTTQNKDISIKNSQRSGISYTDTNGVGYNYLWVTATITNKSMLPMHLVIDFSKGNSYAEGADKSQTFLVPKKWTTPEKYLPSTSKKIELGMSNELKWFLDRVEKTSISFDTILNPEEKCNLTFGLLDRTKIDLPYNIELKVSKDGSPTTTLGLSFDRPQDEHYLIPCGQITFNNN